MVPAGPSVLQSVSLCRDSKCPLISDPQLRLCASGLCNHRLVSTSPRRRAHQGPHCTSILHVVPRTTPFQGHPGLAHSAQASPEDQAVQGTNCLGGGLSNRSPSGARAGWPRVGRPQSHCLQTPAVEIGIPDSRERP